MRFSACHTVRAYLPMDGFRLYNKLHFQGSNNPPDISKKLFSNVRTYGNLYFRNAACQVTASLLSRMAQKSLQSIHTQLRQASVCPLPSSGLTQLVEETLQSLCWSPYYPALPSITITLHKLYLCFGVHLGLHTIQVKRSAQECRLDVVLLELRAVRNTCIHLLPLFKSKSVKVMTNNLACIFYISSQGSA